MTTIFKLLAERCGLSHREAADFLDARTDTVKSWSSGRNPTPIGVISELRDLYRRIESAAAEVLAAANEERPAEIRLHLAPDDGAARAGGWPCRAAQAASLAIVAARTDLPVSISE